VNNTGSDAVLQMWVDYNGDGAFGAGEEVTFTSANTNTIPNGGVASEPYCFDVPADATFFGGAAFVRFRLSPNGGTVPDGQDINAVQFGEIEDYKVPLYKVGSYVWDDLNGDGLQDDFSSPCMDDVEMQLVWGGPDDNLATTGDNQTYLVTSDEVNSIHGQFVFCGLIPGSYELSIADIPSGLAPTVIGAGVDPNYDSNDPNGTAFTIPVNATLPTGENGVGDQPGGINGFPDTQDNLSFDFGLMTDGYTITCNCDGSITLDWDPFAGGDSWTVTLEDENGFPALDFVNMPDHVVTIAPGSLNNGECYRVAITENLSGNEVTSIYGPFHANCYPVPEISMTGVGPTCPDSQDGEVTITITEQGCAATYDVYLTSQNSGELLVGDDIAITAPIVVGGLGEDTYGVRMELVDRGNCAYGESCFPLIENDLLFLQNTDTEPPTKFVYDASGAEVTDMVINYDALPEGECGVQFTWSVVLNDNCLSAGVNLAASITTSSPNPSVTPSASVTVLDNTPTYAVEVFAGVGTNTLTLTATDFNGNENVMVYTINVADNRDPVLYCPTDMNVEIPSCEDEAPVNWTVSVVDDCDLSPTLTQTAGPASGDVLAPGIYNVSYEATDDYGNTGSCSFTITVTQAPSPTPIVDVSGNGNYEIEHCEEDGLIVFSGNVYDCDLDAASFNPADLIVQTTPLSPGAAGSLQISYTLPQDGYVYFEATGNLTAGSYLIITSYQGVTVDHGVIVSQDADQPAVIDMPGNLSYQAADCESEIPVSFAVQLSDDCDEDLGSAIFTVNGAPAPPYDAAASNPTHGLYVWNLSLSAGTYTIVGTYTDGGGNTTVTESTITVNGTQDDWSPIITYPSQNMDIELDPCGPDEQEVCFEVSATDDCSGDVTPSISVTDDSGNTVNLTNTSGNTYCMVLGPGTYSVDISASDAAGNTTSEDFVINITQDDPPLAALICNDDLNVTLDDNCQREITADMLLEGEFGCYGNEDFAITIQDDDPSNGNILDGCGEFIYEITLIGGTGPIDFQPCWGYITGEDKTAPVLECPANTGTGTIVKNGYILSGTIDTDDPTVVVNNWSCLIDNAQPASAGERYVDILPFQVDVSDVYTFLVESDVTQTGNVGFAIYQGGYDVDNPCENIIAQSDILNDGQGNGVGNPLPGAQANDAYVRLALPLQAGATYYLATTTFTPEATGNYQYSICSDDNGQVGYFDTTYVTNPDWSVDEIISFTPVPTSPVTIELPLHCEDFDAIYNNPSSLSLVGSPIVSDNCDQNVAVTFEDTYEQFGDCGDIVITRTFTAVDDKGNSSSCTQVITLSSVIANNRGDSEVWLPPFTVPIECDEDYPTLANGNPSPAIAGYPFVYTVSGIFDLTQGQYCNVGASFEDSPSIVVCDGAFKFTRTWTIVDWCNPIDFYTYSQIIKVGDFTAPTVTCPGEDYDWDGVLDAPVYSTSPFACTAAFEVPLPSVEDNCSDYEVYTEIVTAVEVDVVDQYGQVTGTELDTITVRIVEWDAATRYVSGIPMGAHYFYYLVEDDCGNQTEVYCPFSVEDQIEPTAVCDDDLHVSIAGNDYARIYAEDIDEGSWDNCGIASIEVRRNLFDPINFTCGNSFSLWGDYVDFFCCDAGVEIEIQLRVIDEAGNVNTCWLNVTPEEKVRPYCEAPHNVEVDCTELPYDFDAYDTDQLEALFGAAIATDNCSGAEADELPPVVDLECGFGRIIRRFRATDEAGNQSTNFCQQIVDIHEVHNYEIRFPADAEAICGVAEPDSVIYEELACDLLAVSHTDEFFSASGEECYKIFRTWKVINWCEYDGESAPLVIGRDEDCDGQPGDEAVWILRRPNGYTYIDRDNDETEPNNVPLAFQNICQGWDDFWRKEDSTPGYYEYTQIIKVYDDVDPIITAEEQNFCSYDNVNCDGVVIYPFSIEENCTPEDLTIKVFLDAGADGGVDVNLTESGAFGFTLTGTYPDYTIGGQYPIGCHAFEVHVEDGCGNVTASLLPFCVQDCKAPAPVCINGLAIELMPFDADGDDVPDEGRMAIWASDFIASPITDCSEPVVYSINRVGAPKNIDSTGIVLTCADLGTLVVEIWAWDAAGNSDFCETYINVQDNMGNCTGSSPAIAGAVETEYEALVEDVTISLSGQGTASIQTGADGTYSFAGLVDGYDYTIIPERDGDYLNGVSTFDLVLISQHILGVQLLDSPYKRIAADVNKSESITTLDLIQLRKLILSIDTEFSNNTSWRFVDAAYVFPNPQDPWQEVFPELVNANDLSEYGIAGLDFIAVKIGDVTEDAETTSLLAVEGREMEEVMYLKAEEVAMKAGQEYTINFTIEELQNIYGYQATLNFNTEAVELVDILEGVASEDNFGFTYLDEGMVTTSWNWVPDTEEELPTTLMYSLVLRAKADVNLSEVMSVSSRITKAEAYAVDGQFMDVELSFGWSTPMAKADQFELYQNQPNPANGETLIGFNLPEATTATMTISDITGRVVKLIRLDAVKGYNSVVINASNLPKGVL
ncbi:MAG: GEVED domain-containing protein, partial [Chitinophagales bacterium]|nr:GEVED domain-containing protein [Chitinophagales bacterium]